MIRESSVSPVRPRDRVHVRVWHTLIAAWVVAAPAPSAAQQTPPAAATWEIAGLPSIGYDADEGFGYGAFAEVYRHGDGLRPYVWTVQPSVDISTRGRRDVTLFFDSPHLLPGGWRLDAFLGSERHLATPYFGIGNATAYDPSIEGEDGPSPYYYRFGRVRQRGTVTLQRPLGAAGIRVLFGAGASHNTLDETPFDRGTTLLAEQLATTGATLPGGWSNHVRAGLIRDTRDRELGATRGSWSDLLVQRIDPTLGSDYAYTRWTLTDRRYQPLGGDRLVLANRFLLQGVSGDAPFYDLSIVQTSFKQQEGLGGAKTLRGLPKNRYVGEGLFLWNTEVRWRVVEAELRGTPVHVVLSAFVDQGRVWEREPVLEEVVTDLHRGVGGGVRLGMRSNFVVAVDVGHSAEAAAPVYIGLGYLF
jgi:outer membrane protein assembly factor BamA